MLGAKQYTHRKSLFDMAISFCILTLYLVIVKRTDICGDRQLSTLLTWNKIVLEISLGFERRRGQSVDASAIMTESFLLLIVNVPQEYNDQPKVCRLMAMLVLKTFGSN